MKKSKIKSTPKKSSLSNAEKPETQILSQSPALRFERYHSASGSGYVDFIDMIIPGPKHIRQVLSHDTDGTLTERIVAVYDEFYNRSERIVINQDMTLVTDHTYIRIFNAPGVMTRSTSYYPDGKPAKMIVFEYPEEPSIYQYNLDSSVDFKIYLGANRRCSGKISSNGSDVIINIGENFDGEVPVSMNKILMTAKEVRSLESYITLYDTKTIDINDFEEIRKEDYIKSLSPYYGQHDQDGEYDPEYNESLYRHKIDLLPDVMYRLRD